MASTENISACEAELRGPRNVLLTSRGKNCLRKGTKLGGLLCCHPYVWNDDIDAPVFTTSRLQIAGWVFATVISVSYWIFLLVQCVRVNASTEEEMSTKALVLFAAVLFSYPVFTQTTYWINRERFSDYVRSTLSYYDKFEENYLRETSRASSTSKLGGFLMTYVYYAFATDAVLFIGYSLTRLNSPEQVSSLITSYPIVQAILCILFWSYIGSCFIANGYLHAFTTIGVIFGFFDIMNELGTNETTNWTAEAFQRPPDRIRTYRVVQLQLDAHDRVFWIITASSKYIMMLLAMFCTYGAIRLNNGMVGAVLGLIGVSAVICLVIVLSGWAEFYSRSSNAMAALRIMTARPDVLANEKLGAWLRKSVKSLRVARLPVCGAYYIDKELILNSVGVISDGIFFLLVNF